MIRVGILGFGFMGRMHFKCYKACDACTCGSAGTSDARIVAICDADENKFDATSDVVGNIPGGQEPLDLTGIQLFTDFDKMLAEAELDALSITLPTYMHRDFTVKALEAGVNVLCEKPMALNVAQCRDMIAAAEKSGKVLQIGHCIRFWPEYAKTKQLIESSKYGKVLVASFRRLSMPATWSWDDWITEGSKSGGALLDLHIHDSDFVQYVFGMPKAVSSHGVKVYSDEFDHVVTQYIYDDQKLVTAEGGWIMTPSFGFEMSFNIILERATIVYDCTRKPAFKVCPNQGQSFTPQVEAGDGWLLEIAHFVKKVAGQKVPEIITPTGSLDSIKLVLAEKRSAQTGKEVTIQ
jgi:predicted dehydrogenase